MSPKPGPPRAPRWVGSGHDQWASRDTPPRAHSGSAFVTSASPLPWGPWCRWLREHPVRCWLQELGLGVRGAQSFREPPDWRCDVPGSAAPEGPHRGQQWGGSRRGASRELSTWEGLRFRRPWAAALSAPRGPPGNPGSPPLSGAQEFEIELEGSQALRILCYEKRCRKARLSKEDGGESADRIAGKGQVQVRRPAPRGSGIPARGRARLPRCPCSSPPGDAEGGLGDSDAAPLLPAGSWGNPGPDPHMPPPVPHALPRPRMPRGWVGRQ